MVQISQPIPPSRGAKKTLAKVAGTHKWGYLIPNIENRANLEVNCLGLLYLQSK